MPKPDPRIDAYIIKSAVFAKPVLNHIRKLVHAACPLVEETMKWNFPHFMHKGILCSMAAFNEHCAFGFWHQAMRESLDGGASENAMGQLGRITSIADLPKDSQMTRWIKQAVKLNEDGIKPPRAAAKPNRDVKPPADLLAALRKNKAAQATFEGLSPSHKREYIEWIADAKREETRAKRLATTIKWLAEGKSQNWRYERK